MTTVLPCSAFLLLTVLCSSRLCVIASPDVTGDGVPIKQIGTIKYGVPLEEHHHVVKREADQAFRLGIHYDSSVETGLLDSTTVSTIKNTIVPQLKTFFESLLMVRRMQVPILLNRDCVGGTFFVPPLNSTIRCAQTCENTTMCGQAVVPPEHLKQCIECNSSSAQCERVGNEDGEGVADVDMILYVSAKNVAPCGSGSGSPSAIAFASSCQMESALDRPIAGNVNFCPSAFTTGSSSVIFATAKHEVIHALAFSTSLYPFWRDEQGMPRTERDENGFPPKTSDSTRFTWSNTTIQEFNYTDWEVFSGTVTHTVNLMVTPKVLEHGRRHFGCSTLQGVELENQGGPGTELAHWEKRILGNEVMTGIIDLIVNPVLSNLTLALLEDSGWYQVNYSHGEALAWGYGAGCTFASNSCFKYKKEREGNGQSFAPFCNIASQTDFNCTIDRSSMSICNLGTYSADIAAEYQYFSEPRKGGKSVIIDYCPYQIGFKFDNGKTSECSNATNQPLDNNNNFGEKYGDGSACFTQPIPVRRFSAARGRSAGCYQYTCNADSTKLTIYVQGTGYTCEQPGNTVTVANTPYVGSFQCPSSFKRLCQKSNDNPIMPSISTPTTTSTSTGAPMPTTTGTSTPTSSAHMINAVNFLLLVSFVVALL